MSQPLLSVVVIGRNEGSRLGRCLSSVQCMLLPSASFELIYVDSASVDSSIEVARSHGAQVVRQDATRPTAAGARNAGAASSSGEFLLFLDGDTILDPSFVTVALRQFDDPSVAVVWGQRRELHPRETIFNTVVDLDWISSAEQASYCGGDAIIRRSSFQQVCGYDNTLIAGEEPDLCWRLKQVGYRLIFLDIAMTRHDIDMHSPQQYWRRALRTGYAYAQVSQRFGTSAHPLWKEEASRNRNRAVIFLLGFCLCFAICAATLSIWPGIVALMIFTSLIVRTAMKNGWKTPDLGARLLYGIHSHIQQIPIFFGQLQYRHDLRRDLTRSLIEYKSPQSH